MKEPQLQTDPLCGLINAMYQNTVFFVGGVLFMKRYAHAHTGKTDTIRLLFPKILSNSLICSENLRKMWLRDRRDVFSLRVAIAQELRQQTIQHLRGSDKPVAAGFRTNFACVANIDDDVGRPEGIQQNVVTLQDWFARQGQSGIPASEIELAALGELFDVQIILYIQDVDGREQAPARRIYPATEQVKPERPIINMCFRSPGHYFSPLRDFAYISRHAGALKSNGSEVFPDRQPTLRDQNCLYHAFAEGLYDLLVAQDPSAAIQPRKSSEQHSVFSGSAASNAAMSLQSAASSSSGKTDLPLQSNHSPSVIKDQAPAGTKQQSQLFQVAVSGKKLSARDQATRAEFNNKITPQHQSVIRAQVAQYHRLKSLPLQADLSAQEMQTILRDYRKADYRHTLDWAYCEMQKCDSANVSSVSSSDNEVEEFESSAPMQTV